MATARCTLRLLLYSRIGLKSSQRLSNRFFRPELTSICKTKTVRRPSIFCCIRRNRLPRTRDSPAIQKFLTSSARTALSQIYRDRMQLKVVAPKPNFSKVIFTRGTNGWDQFTLFDLVGVQYNLLSASPAGGDRALFG